MIDYGPLSKLIGTWQGDKGTDIAPEPDGKEQNLYYETIIFSPAGDVSNAEEQDLIAVHYHQQVQRKSDNKAIHNETGYLIWEIGSNRIMQSFAIPRGIAVVAGGHYEHDSATQLTTITVSAGNSSSEWQIAQSPFMQGKAHCLSFEHQLTLKENVLRYTQTTIVDIYCKTFKHTDENELVRIEHH